jgi:hypothetical protein
MGMFHESGNRGVSHGGYCEGVVHDVAPKISRTVFSSEGKPS